MLNQTVLPLPSAAVRTRPTAGVAPGAETGLFGALLAVLLAPPAQPAGPPAAPPERVIAAGGQQAASSPATAPASASPPMPAAGADLLAASDAKPVSAADAEPVRAVLRVQGTSATVRAAPVPTRTAILVGDPAADDEPTAALPIAGFGQAAARAVVPVRSADAQAAAAAPLDVAAANAGPVPVGAPDRSTSDDHRRAPAGSAGGIIARPHDVAVANFTTTTPGTAATPAAGGTVESAAPVGAQSTAATPPARGADGGAPLEPPAPPASERSETAALRMGASSFERVAAAAKPCAAPAAPLEQLQLHLVRAVHGRVERLVVQLEPAELGRVEIQLDFGDDGRVGAVITVERPETLDALQRDAHSLERSLRDAGLRTDGGGLSFSLKRDQQHAGAGARRGSGASPHAGAAASAATNMPEALNLRLRLLDISA